MKAKIEKIYSSNPDPKILERAARVLGRGEVIVCPTDTGYAFSADALNLRAVAKVFQLKGRSFSNPIHVAVHSIEEAEKYAHFNEAARFLAARYLPGALTLVMKKKENIPSLLVAGLDTVGIRIPDNKIILKLTEMLGRPLTTTSANISGKPTPYNIDEIMNQFGETINQVALILDDGPLSSHELSTIVDVSVKIPQLIRQGRISWLEIRQILSELPKNEL